MKLLKTIKKIIQEAEEQLNRANDAALPLEELDKLEKHYKDSFKLGKINVKVLYSVYKSS